MRTSLLLVSVLLVILAGTLWAGWSEPVSVAELNTQYGESTPCISADGLTIYYAKSGTDTFYWHRIYQATRSSLSEPFSNITELSGLNYDGHVNSPWVSSDNLRMYYTREWRIMFTQRSSIDQPWSAGTVVSEFSTYSYRSRLTDDELTMVFTKTDGSQGGEDLYIATRPDKISPFGNVRSLSELNTSVSDDAGWISPDGLSIYFESTRNGPCQLFYATRSSINDPFGDVQHLTEFDYDLGPVAEPTFCMAAEALFFARREYISVSDIFVSYIPEPATMLLLTAGALLLRRR